MYHYSFLKEKWLYAQWDRFCKITTHRFHKYPLNFNESITPFKPLFPPFFLLVWAILNWVSDKPFRELVCVFCRLISVAQLPNRVRNLWFLPNAPLINAFNQLLACLLTMFMFFFNVPLFFFCGKGVFFNFLLPTGAWLKSGCMVYYLHVLLSTIHFWWLNAIKQKLTNF